MHHDFLETHGFLSVRRLFLRFVFIDVADSSEQERAMDARFDFLENHGFLALCEPVILRFLCRDG